VIMAWGWLLRRLGNGQQGLGLWGYLAIRAQNKAAVDREKTRIEATKDLIDHLPSGAVYREGTPDGWREIWMPNASQQSLFLLPVEHLEPTRESPEPPELPSQSQAALEEGVKAETEDDQALSSSPS
jgi:hypothetical protein